MALKLAGVCREFGTLDEELMHDWQLCFSTKGPSRLTVGDAQQVELPIHAYALLATHLFVHCDQYYGALAIKSRLNDAFVLQGTRSGN